MSKKPNNPFIISGFEAKKYFCDRETELSWLMDNWSNERNMALYSWRRMGKTALIRCFYHILMHRHKADTLYVDLLVTRTLQDAVRSITQVVHEFYGRTSSGLSAALGKLLSGIGATVAFDPESGIPKLLFGWNPAGVPEESLASIGKFLSGGKRKVIIALDEFQQVTGYPGQTAEAVFRSWMQSFPRIQFIFSGSHRKMMQSLFTEQNRPFYRSVQLLDLQPIKEQNYSSFIRSHFAESGKKIQPPEIAEIFKWGRGQTYSIQLICNKLFGSCTSVKPEDLQRVFREIIEQEKPVFANYARLLTGTQWDVLRAISKEEPLLNPLAKEFIHRYGLGAGSTVNTALKALQSKEMVIRQEDGYYVHDVLLSRWLRTA